MSPGTKNASMNTSIELPVRRSRLGQWLLGSVLLLAGAGLVWYYGIGQPPAGPPGGGGRFGMRGEVPPVRVVEAEQRNIEVTLKALGTVTPINTVTVRSRLDGELVQGATSPKASASRPGRCWPRSTRGPTKWRWRRPQGARAENEARLKNARADLERSSRCSSGSSFPSSSSRARNRW